MPKFKDGDRVKVISTISSNVKTGDVGTIREYSGMSYGEDYVDFENDRLGGERIKGVFTKRFKAIGFKEGDRVVFARPNLSSNKGAEGTVVKEDSGDGWLTVDFDKKLPSSGLGITHKRNVRLETKKFDLIEGKEETVNTKPASERGTYHCMKHNEENPGLFDKVGDHTFNDWDECDKFLFEHYGYGKYSVKIKNAGVGRNFTIKEPTDSFSVVEGH